MKLTQLFQDIETLSTVSLPDVEIRNVTSDTRKLVPNSLFVAQKGLHTDGHDLATQAIADGAVAIVAERELPGLAVPVILVNSTRMVYGPLLANLYGRPADSMTILGVTGTNGKSTTTYLLDKILRAAGYRTGRFCTVERRIGDNAVYSPLTTPSADVLQSFLVECRDAGLSHIIVEMSSHGLDQGRCEGIPLTAAALTNVTHDHLDYHHTIRGVYEAKSHIFDLVKKDGSASPNLDDPYGRAAYDKAAHLGLRLLGFSHRDASAPIFGTIVEERLDGTRFILRIREEGTIERDQQAASWTQIGNLLEAEVNFPHPGIYNMENALASAGLAYGIGVPFTAIVEGLQHADQVPGRMQEIKAGQSFKVIIDYAHSPDSLDKALRLLRKFHPGKRLVIGFGCPGSRDYEKRPLMGMIAAELADFTIVTSEDPRDEDADKIAREVVYGLSAAGARFGEDYLVEVNRRAAVRLGLSICDDNCVLVFFGKGHERTQTIKGIDHPYYDPDVVVEEWQKLASERR